MRQMLWLNNIHPVLPTDHTCSVVWLLSRIRSGLSTVDEDNLEPHILAVLEAANVPRLQRSANSLSAGVRLFWYTRLEPTEVPLAKLKVILPQLAVYGADVPDFINTKIVRVSDRRDS